MADPLSITAATLAIVTAAVQSVKSLHEAVRRFKDRDQTLARLDDGLRDLIHILCSLNSITEADDSVLVLLQGPVERCSQVCHDLELAMQVFGRKSKTGFRDWARMEFMRGGLNDFIDTLADYKSTISVGLGSITMHNTKVTQQAFEQFSEMIQNTMHHLKLQLQRLEGEMALLKDDEQESSSMNVELSEEKTVTYQCLRICENARDQLWGLRNRSADVLPQSSEQQPVFEAQSRTRQAMDDAEANFASVCHDLSKQLNDIISNASAGTEAKRAQLKADMGLAKQGLELCSIARESSRQKVCRIGEIVADDNSDQVAVNTLADLFEVRKAQSTGESAQLFEMFGEDSLQLLAEKRYNSRFGAPRSNSVQGTTPSDSMTQVTEQRDTSSHGHRRGGDDRHSGRSKPAKPAPNEVRRRVTDDTHE